MNENHIVEITVTEHLPEVLDVAVTTGVEAGSLLRLKTDGLSLLRGVVVKGVRKKGTSDLYPEVHRYSRDEQRKNWGWYIKAMPMITVQVEDALRSGEILEILLEPECEVVTAGLEWDIATGTIAAKEDAELEEVADPITLKFIAGPAAYAEAYLKPGGRTMATTYDVYGNPARDGTASAAQPRPDGRIPVETDFGATCVSNAPPEALDGTLLWFGEIHWHTDFSGDGQRSTEDALTSARDELGLDFAGPADHMSPAGAYSRNGTPERQAEICRSFDHPGKFVTIPGAELSARYGHANLYADSFDTFLDVTSKFSDQLSPAFAAHQNSYALNELARICPEGRALAVPHHANMDSQISEGVVRDDGRPFWCAMHWPIPADRSAVRLVEIVQNRGCFEAEEPDPYWKILFGGLGGSARTALMRGYRVGFIAGTDNHTGWPSRRAGEAGYGGLTVVQCEKLSTASVFDALYRRRCYATSGARIVADATLNGNHIGSELMLEPGAQRTFKISIRGTTPITDVQIIHTGFVLHSFEITGDDLDFRTEWSDERPGRPLQDSYYYVRARQSDGHCVWLSPFWVDLQE